MRLLLFPLLCLLTGPAAAAASPLPSPEGPVLLTLAGAITHTNAPGEARFDLAMLEALGSVQLVTRTPWTEGEGVFEGVSMRALLAAAGARGTRLRALALNDYESVIPLSDVSTYDIIIAWKQDGRLLRRRDKGPLWIVYPFSDHPELDRRLFRQRAVWQLHRIVVE